jgi:phospholipase/carboxylesterase
VASLLTVERPAASAPAALLFLHHGLGGDERDVLPLGDAVDPDRRLLVVSARAPLTREGSPGYHWYVAPRVGYPDPETFASAYRALADLHEELWCRTGLGPAQTILAGFSMGSVMSYALGLGADRPPPAGILAFTGFVPRVRGWLPDVAGREHVRALIAHGRNDPEIDVAFARRARDLLSGAGLAVEYHESNLAHQIEPGHIDAARRWLDQTLEHVDALGVERGP